MITPNLGFSYKPDFSNSQYGYYKNVQSSTGNTEEYSIIQNGIWLPSKGKQGNIILNISNILEAKLNSKKTQLNQQKR